MSVLRRPSTEAKWERYPEATVVVCKPTDRLSEDVGHYMIEMCRLQDVTRKDTQKLPAQDLSTTPKQKASPWGEQGHQVTWFLSFAVLLIMIFVYHNMICNIIRMIRIVMQYIIHAYCIQTCMHAGMLIVTICFNRQSKTSRPSRRHSCVPATGIAVQSSASRVA